MYEEAAFPVRVQSEADLAARDPRRIEAWDNPFARDGLGPFRLAGVERASEPGQIVLARNSPPRVISASLPLLL